MSFRLPFGRDLGIYRPSVKKVSGHGNAPTSHFVKGDKVIFSPTCTCEGCLLVEKWYLDRDVIFTVKTVVEKNNWETIELEEVPEKFFASMMFLKK